jgi:hypothetical protein
MTDMNYPLNDYHSKSFRLTCAQPKPLIFLNDKQKWFALRNYQEKAVFDFMDSGAVGSYLDIAKLGFSIPHQFKKQYVIDDFHFHLLYRGMDKIIKNIDKKSKLPEYLNPDEYSYRQSWPYHHIYLIRQDNSESLIMGFPQKLKWSELNKDEEFLKYGKIDESVRDLFDESKGQEADLIYLKGLLD